MITSYRFDTGEDAVVPANGTVIMLSSCFVSLAYDAESALYIQTIEKWMMLS